MGFSGGSVGREPTCNAADPGLIPGQEDPLEYGMATHSIFLLENPMDRGTWWAPVHGVAKSWTQLSD